MTNFDYKTKAKKDPKMAKLKKLRKIEKSVDSKIEKDYYKSYKKDTQKYDDLVKDKIGFNKYLI